MTRRSPRGHPRRGYRRRDGTWVRPTYVNGPSYRFDTSWELQPGGQQVRDLTVGQASQRWRGRRSHRRAIDEAVEFCAEILMDEEGWRNAVAGRAAKYVSQQTWERVTAGWHGYRCRPLARLARRILTGKDNLHEAVGATYRVWSWLGRPRIERVFAREVAERVPLPTDQALIAAARAVHVTGIYVWVAAGRDLTYCECFIDVVKAEGQKQIKALLLAATDDWDHLGRIVPVPEQDVANPYGAPRDVRIGNREA
jgi:hypothetical protein